MKDNGKNVKGWGWDSSNPFGKMPDARTSFTVGPHGPPGTGTPEAPATPVNGGPSPYTTPPAPHTPAPPPGSTYTTPSVPSAGVPTPNGVYPGAGAPPGGEYEHPEVTGVPNGNGAPPVNGTNGGWTEENGMTGPRINGEEAAGAPAKNGKTGMIVAGVGAGILALGGLAWVIFKGRK